MDVARTPSTPDGNPEMADAAPEPVAPEPRPALAAIGPVTAEIYTDDILDRVFSRFCIGK